MIRMILANSNNKNKSHTRVLLLIQYLIMIIKWYICIYIYIYLTIIIENATIMNYSKLIENLVTPKKTGRNTNNPHKWQHLKKTGIYYETSTQLRRYLKRKRKSDGKFLFCLILIRKWWTKDSWWWWSCVSPYSRDNDY